MPKMDFSEEIGNHDFQVADGLHLIEASAGTGKTYSIQDVYARLVMETDFRVANILVVTFTEAATKELQERLRAILSDLQRRLGDPVQDCDGKDEEEIQKRNSRADGLISCACRETARKRVELALLEFDGATISTIHGFCQRVLQRYAFETGMKFTQEIRNDKNAELKARAEDWWRIHNSIDLNKLTTYVQELGSKADYTIAPSREEVENTLAVIGKIEAKRSPGGNGMVAQQLQDALKEAMDGQKDVNGEVLDALLEYLQEAIDAKVKGATRDAKAIYKIWSNNKELRIPDAIVAQYEKERFVREALTFDDLLRGLRDALKDDGTGKLAALLRQEYRAALIDEFQDTDPVQYDIFKRIFLSGDNSHPGPLYFVGDPKQAIYAFRGGDIYTYFNATADGSLQQHSLNVNHRSASRLVKAVNAMFHEENPGQTFGSPSITFEDSTPQKDDVKYGKEPEITGEPLTHPLQIVEFCHQGSKAPSKATYLPYIIARMTDEILDILAKTENGKRIFSPKDIAILMDTTTEMPKLQQALLANGIPSVIKDAGNVFQTSIAYELRAFLLAVSKAASPRREDVRAALLTVFGGMTFKEADALDDQAFAQRLTRLKKLKDTWCFQGFPALASQMEEDDYLLRLAHRPNGRRLLSDIGQILELCCAATKEVGSSPEALVNWLTERIQNAANGDKTEAEEYARELETDGEAVKIMTIHASKGLQFPIVFLPDCWRVNSTHDPRNQFPLPYYHNEKDGQLVFAANAQDRAKEELTMEKIRLLYVALTRAKQQTILFAPSKFPNGEPLQNLLGKLKGENGVNPYCEWIEWQRPTEYKTRNASYAAPVEDEEPIEVGKLRKDWDKSPVKGSYSSLAPHATGDDDSRDNDELPFPEEWKGNDPPRDIFDLPAGAKIGTCWHDILEKVAFDADTEGIRQLAQDELLANGFSADEKTLDITAHMIAATLDHRLKAPDGKEFSLREVGWGDRLSEQEFDFSSANAESSTASFRTILQRHWGGDATKGEFLKAMANWSTPVPKGYLKGFMDLVFRHDGRYYVVDWKSNTLDRDIGNFTAEGIRAEMAKNGYFFQYMLYAAVLHCHLKARLGDAYSHERDFGGVRYYFLRGMETGAAPVFEDRPSEALLDDFAKALGMEVK